MELKHEKKKDSTNEEFSVGAGLLAAAGVLLGGAIAGGLILSSQKQPQATAQPTNETELRQMIKQNISSILECNVRLKNEEYKYGKEINNPRTF